MFKGMFRLDGFTNASLGEDDPAADYGGPSLDRDALLPGTTDPATGGPATVSTEADAARLRANLISRMNVLRHMNLRPGSALSPEQRRAVTEALLRGGLRPTGPGGAPGVDNASAAATGGATGTAGETVGSWLSRNKVLVAAGVLAIGVGGYLAWRKWGRRKTATKNRRRRNRGRSFAEGRGHKSRRANRGEYPIYEVHCVGDRGKEEWSEAATLHGALKTAHRAHRLTGQQCRIIGHSFFGRRRLAAEITKSGEVKLYERPEA